LDAEVGWKDRQIVRQRIAHLPKNLTLLVSIDGDREAVDESVHRRIRVARRIAAGISGCRSRAVARVEVAPDLVARLARLSLECGERRAVLAVLLPRGGD